MFTFDWFLLRFTPHIPRICFWPNMFRVESYTIDVIYILSVSKKKMRWQNWHMSVKYKIQIFSKNINSVFSKDVLIWFCFSEYKKNEKVQILIYIGYIALYYRSKQYIVNTPNTIKLREIKHFIIQWCRLIFLMIAILSIKNNLEWN